MKKVIKKIKDIDAYKVEQTFNTSGDSDQKRIGSLVGGVFTLLMIVLSTYFFGSDIVRMHNGKDDVQTHKSRPNYLIDGENIIQIFNSTFLPSLELYTNEVDPRIDSIIEGPDGIVMEELLTYIEPVIMIVNETQDNPT